MPNRKCKLRTLMSDGIFLKSYSVTNSARVSKKTPTKMRVYRENIRELSKFHKDKVKPPYHSLDVWLLPMRGFIIVPLYMVNSRRTPSVIPHTVHVLNYSEIILCKHELYRMSVVLTTGPPQRDKLFEACAMIFIKSSS